MNAVLIAEAISAAQQLTGKKLVSGEDVRRGLETLKISDARWTELGLPGFAAPINLSCRDHNGHNGIYLVEWDRSKWTKASGWIEPIKDKVLPLIESAAAIVRQCRLAQANRSLRQVVVRRASSQAKTHFASLD
jgi:branched-chain amino acid transport system substrate-binding protein